MACRLGIWLIGGVLLAGMTSPALAQGGCGPYGGYQYNIYGTESIPYFALHPPVYYSFPIPRTYGYSPFAYPPGVMTPEIEVRMLEPKVMQNPFVPKQNTSLEEQPLTAQAPLKIENPFARSPESAAPAQLAQWPQASRQKD